MTRTPTVMVQPKPRPPYVASGNGVRQLVPGTGLVATGTRPRIITPSVSRVVNVQPSTVNNAVVGTMATTVTPTNPVAAETKTEQIENGSPALVIEDQDCDGSSSSSGEEPSGGEEEKREEEPMDVDKPSVVSAAVPTTLPSAVVEPVVSSSNTDAAPIKGESY